MMNYESCYMVQVRVWKKIVAFWGRDIWGKGSNLQNLLTLAV